MYNILISQKIKKKNNKMEFILEDNWLRYFFGTKVNLVTIKSDNFKKKKLNTLNLKGLILHGGNDLPKFKKLKENVIRRRIDMRLIKYAFSKKIPILAVCYGFQLIADLFGSKLIKSNNHVKKMHKLNLEFRYKKKYFKSLNVNSFHNYIVTKLPKIFNYIFRVNDQSIELAISKKYKIMCCMFHPERKSKDFALQKKLILSHFSLRGTI